MARRAKHHRCSEADLELLQTEALRSLVKHLGSGRPLGELMDALLRGVVATDGTKVFQPELVAADVDQVLRQADSVTEEKEGEEVPMVPLDKADKTALVVQVLHDLARQCGRRFSDVAGQVLWRHRGSAALQGHHRRTAEDLTWLNGCDADLVARPVVALVEDVFRAMTADEESKHMRFRQWQKVVRLIQKNPVLERQVKVRDVELLFYAKTHDSSVHVSISRREFKQLLMELAERMEVHPSLVYMAVGCHAEHLSSEMRQ